MKYSLSYYKRFLQKVFQMINISYFDYLFFG